MTILISQLTEGVNIYKLFLEESFAFQFSICKHKDQDIQNCNFAYFIWVCSLVLHSEGGTHAAGVREQSAEEDIWAHEG